MMSQLRIVYLQVLARDENRGDLDMPLNSGIQSHVTRDGHIWPWRGQLEINIVRVHGLRGLAGTLNLTEPETCEE